MRRGFTRGRGLHVSGGIDTTVVRTSLDALDRDSLHVLVLAVVADPDESFLELERFESWEVFRVTSQEDAFRFGSSNRRGMPQ